MEGNAPIEGLLDEILEEIFSYLSVEDLAGSVQHVCCRWKEICSSPKLWKTVTYRPGLNDDEEAIINILENAPKLTNVNFDRVVVSPKTIETLAHSCSKLTRLVLVDITVVNNRSNELLREIQSNCPCLEHLTVDDTLFRDTKMGEIIGNFITLKSFVVIQNTCISKLINLKPIADGCPKLEHLELPNLIRASEELRYLLEKKKDILKYLGIVCGTEDGHCTLPLLSICSQLKTLHINKVCRTRIIEGLKLSEKCETLTTFRWTLLTAANVNKIMRFFCSEKLCRLQEMYISHFINYEDRLVDVIIRYCPLLKKLHLPHCCNLSDESLKNLHHLQHLESVNFCASQVSDLGVRFLDLCEQLQYIDLSCCRITGRIILEIRSLTKLKVLILEACRIKGIPLEMIPTSLPALRKLSIRYCYGIKKEDIEHLQSKMPQLQVVR